MGQIFIYEYLYAYYFAQFLNAKALDNIDIDEKIEFKNRI